MSVLFELPFDIQYVVVGEWCIGSELVRLDTASCNRTYRTTLLQLIAHTPSIAFEKTSFKSFVWLQSRGVHMKNLYLSDRVFKNGFAAFCNELPLDRLESLHLKWLSEGPAKYATTLANKSKLLKSLTIESVQHCLKDIDSSTLSKLNEVTIIDARLEKECVGRIVANCRSLQKLKLWGSVHVSHSSSLGPMFRDLIVENPDLRECDLALGDGSLLEEIFKHCPLIEKITLGGTLSIPEVAVVLSDHPDLKQLQLGHSFRYINRGLGGELRIRHEGNYRSIETLIQAQKNLRKLKLEFCSVNDNVVQSILQCAASLEILDLGNSSEVSGSVWKEIIRRCPRLIHLEGVMGNREQLLDLMDVPNNLQFVRFNCQVDDFNDEEEEDSGQGQLFTVSDVMNCIKSFTHVTRFHFNYIDETDSCFFELKQLLYDLKDKGRHVTLVLGIDSSRFFGAILCFKNGQFGGCDVDHLLRGMLTSEELATVKLDFHWRDFEKSIDGDRPLTPPPPPPPLVVQEDEVSVAEGAREGGLTFEYDARIEEHWVPADVVTGEEDNGEWEWEEDEEEEEENGHEE